MEKSLVIFSIVVLLSGCSTAFSPKNVAENESGYTYVPIDPFPVVTLRGENCNGSPDEKGKIYGNLLKSLPDNSVRMLIEQFNQSGTVTYGPVKVGEKGESYRVTVDYINADTINVKVGIAKTMARVKGGELNIPLSSHLTVDHLALDRSMMEKYSGVAVIPGSEAYQVYRMNADEKVIKEFVEYNIPVYIGVGLRVSANVDVIGGSANISGIGSIGAEAEANKLKGTLVVQTLGVNGKSIAAALPIQSELNRTTAQNAIVAVGSIKALLYDGETVIYPRVVGIYLPFPGGKPLVNAIISALSTGQVEWHRPCTEERPKEK